LEASDIEAHELDARHPAGKGESRLRDQHGYIDLWGTRRCSRRYVPVRTALDELADWVAKSRKNLTTIYITHADGDHSFGLQLVLDRFPGAKAIATAAVVAAIREQIKPAFGRGI
jgi:glyoxylase-like metal-dependent hydrolase (beta-lactamase superfamily II)